MWERVRDWLAERRQKLDLFDETLVARQDNPLYLMGPMLYYFWLITVVTGVILMLWYEPTTTGAYSSIERIQNDIGRLAVTFLGHPVTLGGLVRGLHKYGADALITVMFLRGPAVGQATITRFYAIHFGVSLVLLILVEVMFQRTRRKRINMSLFPLTLFLIMLIVISIILPAESGRRADPTRTPLPILSDWYFLALYQYVKYTPPLWAGLGPGLLIGFGMLVPFLDRSKGRGPLQRPFFTVVGALA